LLTIGQVFFYMLECVAALQCCSSQNALA